VKGGLFWLWWLIVLAYPSKRHGSPAAAGPPVSSPQGQIGAEEGMGEYGYTILRKRKENWIPVMARMMADKPTLFAVGAGHLCGP
jgi:hypothetical protein